ncbi:helix-turn-helix domain-containing protein [Natronosalvus halobius]|uniref:helix-turn-helix domain-containing protein n=1 Tax=Natronosalvus halobius TaxID=2953746 RepID=UPI00209F0B8E|nr:helix-turn-helix domain-containing protein [Natronosalvus halobius]USZ70829.1 helix-turn-helix domain-containing protein [Natronosalvus halobius]
MGFVAHVSLSHPDLVLAPTIRAHSNVTMRFEYGVVTDSRERCFVSIFSDEFDHIEQTMANDRTISSPTRVATFSGRSIYQMTVETGLEIVPYRCSVRGIFVFETISNDNGWDVRVHIPDRETLSAFREYCRSRSISFRVNRLSESTADDDGDTYFLTERQHEILSKAYYSGYFEIPRRASQDDLANQLGISTSAVSQRIRRAVGELIESTLENSRTPDR